MSTDYDKNAYPEPPKRTPVVEKLSAVPNPALILGEIFYYAVDVPVTKFREAIDSIRSKNNFVYYHERFRRVPDLTECEEGDFVCQYEAEMQWRRDFKVDQEIVQVIQQRMGACVEREGESYIQNCAKEYDQFVEVAKHYQSRYGDMGAYANSKKCLMKQKERMMAAQAKQS